MRFGLAVQSLPARLAPEAVRRVLSIHKAHRQDGEIFRQYVMRHKVEFFRALTAGFSQASRVVRGDLPGLGRRYRTTSLQLGRGECAA